MSILSKTQKDLTSFGAKFAETGKSVTIPLTGRNRRIISLLRLEGSMNTDELAKRLKLGESTVLIELIYLQNLGFVKQVSGGRLERKRLERQPKTIRRKGGLEKWLPKGVTYV